MDVYGVLKDFVERFHAECIGVAEREIVGVRLQVGSEELREHLSARARWHLSRATWCERQAEDMAGGIGADPHAAGGPSGSMRERGRGRRDEAARFEALARYLMPGRVFRLDERDIQRLQLDRRMD